MRDPRLGDDIDDFCVRCKRVMNHAVVSVVDNKPAKVRCRTCHSDHDFRNEQPPPPKVDLRKQALFTEVLKKVSPGDGAAAGEVDPELMAEADELEVDEVDAEPAAEAEAEIEPEPKAVAETRKPKTKAKAKATTRKK
jgi:hypothetical protein